MLIDILKDANRFCPNGNTRIAAPLKPANRTLVRVAGIVYLSLLASAPARGQQNAFRQFLSAEVGNQQPQVRFQSYADFQEGVEDQDVDFQSMRYDLRLSLPLHQTTQQEWTLLSRIGYRDIETRAILPDTFDAFPDSLWDLRLQVAHRRKLDNDWIAGGSLEVGSPSDRPFASLDEVQVMANLFLRIPAADERDAWMFFLNYSNARDFARFIPLPGIAYQMDRGPTFRMLLGVPLVNIAYQPVEKAKLELTYFIPRTLRARAGYELFDGIELYGLFAWNNQSYFRHDRWDDDDQLVWYEKRMVGGVVWNATEQVSVDFSAGYGFDRFFYEGEDYSDRGDNRINIDDGPIAQVRVAVEF